jgi:hypothetical protein
MALKHVVCKTDVVGEDKSNIIRYVSSFDPGRPDNFLEGDFEMILAASNGGYGLREFLADRKFEPRIQYVDNPRDARLFDHREGTFLSAASFLAYIRLCSRDSDGLRVDSVRIDD